MRRIFALIVLVLTTTAAKADCRSIVNDADRLQCFDQTDPSGPGISASPTIRRLVRATVSPDILPQNFDLKPFALCLQSLRISAREIERMIKAEAPSKRARACYDKHIGR